MEQEEFRHWAAFAMHKLPHLERFPAASLEILPTMEL